MERKERTGKGNAHECPLVEKQSAEGEIQKIVSLQQMRGIK